MSNKPSNMLSGVRAKLYNFFKDPNDIYSAIHPLFCVCSVFGLAPYTVERLQDGKKVFKFAWISLIRNVLLVVILIGSLGYDAIFQNSPFSESNMKEKLRYFQMFFSNILSCFAVIFGCIYALKIIEVFKNIDEVDVSFRTLALWVPYKDLYVTIIFNLVGLFAFIALIMIQFGLLTSQIYSHSFYSIYIVVITIFLPYFINLLMELQYCIYLNILRTRYRLLNEYLDSLVNETKTSILLTEKEITVLPCKPDKLPKSMLSISDPVFIVDQVAALHIKLTDTAHMINNAFCVQQLLRITVAFLSIVTALFLIAVKFSKGSGTGQNERLETHLDYIFTAWAFSNALEVVTIVWITSETCEEANTCPRILHKIRNNTDNIDLQDTIEIYSLQMFHNRLFFTVCGLFPLDYTLLYTIVAGVTTYLVILIQFNSTDFVNVANNTEIANFTNISHQA